LVVSNTNLDSERFNGRIGNQPVSECIELYGEQVMNHNGAALRDFLCI